MGDQGPECVRLQEDRPGALLLPEQGLCRRGKLRKAIMSVGYRASFSRVSRTMTRAMPRMKARPGTTSRISERRKCSIGGRRVISHDICGFVFFCTRGNPVFVEP